MSMQMIFNEPLTEDDLQDAVQAFARSHNDHPVNLIIRELGLSTATRICSLFEGQHLYMPRVTSLMRALQPIIVRKELSRCVEGSLAWRTAVRKFMDRFRMSKRDVLEMYRRRRVGDVFK